MKAEGTQSRGRRSGKYIQESCMICRLKRIKCNGEKPVCSSCEHSGRECSWVKDVRKPRTELRLEAMQKRVVALNEYIYKLESMVDDCHREHEDGEDYMDRDDSVKEDRNLQVDELADGILQLRVDDTTLVKDTEPLVF